MSFEIIPTSNFARQLKKLDKKHHSLKDDMEVLETELSESPTKGIHLGSNVQKIRLAITSKGKGKSGGARVITYVIVLDKQVFLMNIYDKGEKDSISKKEIDELLKNTGLKP